MRDNIIALVKSVILYGIYSILVEGIKYIV